MYSNAKKTIEALYPNATVSGESTPGRTGWFEVTVTRKDGTNELVYSKKNGDGAFKQDSCKKLAEKMKRFVESS